MRHCTKLLLSGLVLLVSLVSAGFKAQAAIDNTAYGVLAFSDDQYRMTNNVVKFDLLSDSEPVFQRSVVFNETSTAGAYGGQFYYIATSVPGTDGELPKALVRVDLTSGNYTTVGALTGFNSFINDMTYDWSTSKMYCVAKVDNTISALYTIDLSTAKAQRVANLDRRFFTLAASYSGQLYGIGYAGEFCKINKTTGEVTVVGHTGYYPQQFQCMEFDHGDRTLYWMASTHAINPAGTLEIQECFVATVDVNTGKVNRRQNFGDNQLVGLYIPSFAAADDCPGPVTAPKVAAAPEGASSATISWVNPTTTFGGEPLKTITKVEISRDGNVVGTVTGAQPGKESKFVDNISASTGGVYNWLITPYSANGKGASVSVSAFVGKDVPAAVTGIEVEKLTPQSARISWSTVTEGKNGGWTDLSTMKYSVVRNPDEAEIASGITETECIDSGVDVSGTYTYTVIASNSCGSSDPSESAEIALGPKLSIPYTCTFTNDFGQWTAVDANEDQNKWVRQSISWAQADGAYFMTSSKPGDDWLISNPMEFEPNTSYKVRLYCFANGDHPLDFYLLENSDINNPLQKVHTLALERYFELAWKEFQFTTGEGVSDCNFAIHNRAEQGNSYMIIDRIEIEKVADNNLAATSVRGNQKPVEGNTYFYTVTVTNMGTNSFSGYQVVLLDQNDTQLATSTVNDAIASGESADVSLEYSYPLGAAVTAVRGKVIADGDQIESDNMTPALSIKVLPVGSPEEVNIGEKEGTSYFHPLSLISKYGASLNIYDASEVGVKRGRIKGIKFSGSVASYLSGASNVGVKVYLAHTDRTKATEGWIPENEMTLVFDDTIDIYSGEDVYDIDFSRAFDYEGGNLAVLTVTSLENSNVAYLYCSQPYYTSPIPGNNAVSYGGDTPFDFTGRASSRTGNSVITLMVQSGGASISGMVKDNNGNPLEGADVSIKELSAITKTAADGSYRFDFMPKAVYTVSASMFGYRAEEPIRLTVDADATANFTLTKLPTYSVEGVAKDASGAPLVGASVVLTGYTELNTVTASDGKFSFSNVVISPNSAVCISKPWYVSAEREFDLSADKNLGNITLDYAHFNPVNVKGEETDNGVELSWGDPGAVAELRYDSGEVAVQIGLSNEIGTAVIGSVFRNPMTLSSVSWYTTSEGGPHHSVNLYIYDLDEEGNPTGTLLYSERAVQNKDDEWKVYELPAPVEAPRGCFVSINYPGFHAIGIDGDPRSYPVPENTYAFSVDYNSGDFMYFEPEAVGGNLLIRAIGKLYSDEGMINGEEAAPEFLKYNVWRTVGYNSTDWKAVNTTPVALTSLTDEAWNTLPAGVYRYAVSAVYPDNTESEKVCTQYISRLMYGSLAMKVKTNSYSGNATGAVVTLNATDSGESYTATVGADGKVNFTDIWCSNYNVEIELPGYEFTPVPINMIADPHADLGDLVLKEIIATPVNMAVTVKGDTGYRFTWNESGEIFDDFESHVPFTPASAGEVGWQYRDGDGARTFAESDFDFPGRTQPGSFMVFNPWLTTPGMAELRSASLPLSGNAELACFAGFTGSDDWFISPKLTYYNDFTFSFFARGYSQTYGEVIRVGYSTTDTEPGSFTWLTDNVDVPKQTWTKFEYTVPANARYVALNCVSPDGFMLFVDDVKISSGNEFPMNTAITGPEVKYEVWLDNDKVAETEGCSYVFDNVPAGEHTAKVKAVYASGASEPATVQFGTRGIGSVRDESISIAPNPAGEYTVVKGDFKKALLYDLSGVLRKVYDNSDSYLDLSDISAGYYILVVEAESGVSVPCKLTVRK